MESWDKLTIDTPEQTSLEYPIAGLGSRFLAILADTAIQIVLGFIVLIVGVIIGAGVATLGGLAPQWALAIVILLIFLLNSGYFALFEIFWNGQTPGKRYAQIRVIKDDGRPIGAYEAIVRNALRLVDMLPAMYGIGLLSIFVSRQSKRLGDFVAGTVVVHEKTLEGVRPYVETKIDDTLPPIDTTKVTLDEVRLIETFLNRRDSLEPAVRTNMALQISNRLADKMEITISGWPRTERFLEAVIEQCRQSDRFRN
ncbi:MAG TPA: RDD family protein [Candidatus Acidoferrales bacterium]|nr:RDD family protein [Candidatus Acidoferrales bacterium]